MVENVCALIYNEYFENYVDFIVDNAPVLKGIEVTLTYLKTIRKKFITLYKNTVRKTVPILIL